MPSDRIAADVLDRMLSDAEQRQLPEALDRYARERWPMPTLAELRAGYVARPAGDEIVDHIDPKESPWL